MSNLNKIFLMGRLTRDPELRYTPQGTPVCDLGLAVNREYSTNSGERRKDTLFIDVTVWRRQAEVCAQYLSKGRPLFVEGRLEMDTWEGQDGQKRTRYRVVAENFQFLGGGGGNGGPSGRGEQGETSYGGDYRRSEPAEENVEEASGIPESDIPF